MKTLALHRITFFLFPFFLFLLSSTLCVATSYTWTGTTNTSWTTTTNWSPNGNPTATDYIVIQTGTNNLVLTGNKTITRFRINSGVMDLNGYTLTVTDQVLMYGGVVEAGKILQNGTNTAYITSTEVNCKLDLTATTVTAYYSDFADSVKVKQTTTSGTIYWHGNRFYKHLHVENTSNGNMNIGNNPADTCFDGLTMTGRRIRFGYQHAGNLVVGDVVINSTGPSGTQMGVVTGNTNGGAHVDGNIYVNQTTNAQVFFSLAGQMTQSAGHSILDGTTGFRTGEMKIQNLTQLGSGGGITLTYGASTQTMMIEPDAQLGSLNLDLNDVDIDQAVIKGNAMVVANDLTVTDNRFEAACALTHNGTTTSDNGGNIFVGPLSLTSNCTGAANTYLANTGVDTAYSDVHLIMTTSKNLVVGETHDFFLKGSLYCNQQAGNIILGGPYGGTFKVVGTANQTMDLQQGGTILSRNVQINKPSGRVFLKGEMDVDQALTLTSGVVRTLHDAFVNIRDGVTVSGTSDASYIEGLVEKDGNDVFTFPVGRNGIYQPLTISAPSSTAHTFRAEYFDEDSDPSYTHSSRVANIAYLDRTQYWMFTRTAGTGHVAVTIGWRDVACGISSISDPDVCAWNGTQWKNMGNAAEAGTVVTGTARTEKASPFYGPYTWGNFSGISAHAGPDRVMEAGDTVQIGIMTQPDWDYDWTPSGTVEEPDSAITRAYPTTKTQYVLEVTGENSCTATDTAIVFITVMPEDTARSSLDFVVNNGQIIDTDGAPRPDIGIYSHQASPMVYCGDNRVSFVQSKIDTLAATPDTLARVDINFHETFRNAEPLGMGLNPHHYNYYYAHCPEGVTLTPTYNRVVYPQLYENADLHIKGNNAWMKFEFVIHPGGDPEDILMTFEGADNVQVIQQLGLLVVTSSIGTYVFPKPKALKIDTVSGAVELGWQPDWDLSVEGDTVRFTNIGRYNPAEGLVFTLGEEPFATEPSDCDWSTYHGGGGNDNGRDVTTDDSGNVYFCGSTTTDGFPNVSGSIWSVFRGIEDAFINKFDVDGAPKWGTYYGGQETDFANALALNSTGDVYVVGYTRSMNLIVFPDNTNLSGPDDGFVMRLSNDGSELIHARYFGSTGSNTGDMARDIAIDENDNAYFVGVMPGFFDSVSKTGAYNQTGTTATSSYPDAYIAELNSSNEVIWATYFGGNGPDNFSSVAIGEDNSVLVSGSTLSINAASLDMGSTPCNVPDSPIYFPDCNPGGGAYHSTYNGTGADEDAIIVQFDQNSALEWSTYFGGEGNETAYSGISVLKNAVAVNPNDPSIVYLVGGTGDLEGFPTMGSDPEYYQTESILGRRAFIAKFNEKAQEWTTVFGGGTFTDAFDVAVSSNNCVYMVGHTNASDYASNTCDVPDSETDEFAKCEAADVYFQPHYGGGARDGYIAAFNSVNHLIWSTYYGGNSFDEIDAVNFNGSEQRIYITGNTGSTSAFPRLDPETGNYQLNTNSGGVNNKDTYLARFCVSTLTNVQEINSTQPKLDIIAYPNPTNESVNIQITLESQERNFTLNMFNVAGMLVYESQENAKSGTSIFTVDVSQFSSGLYFIGVEFGSERYSTKIIVE